jgi:hypothetical protein
VRELSRVADEHTEADWICAARGKTAREIERLVSGRKPGDLPSDPAKPEARRHVLRLDLSAESYATFREAVAKLRRESSGPMGNRATQTIPPAVRRQVMRRHSGCCAVPGCRSAVFLDCHHVDPRAEGGRHDPERLLILCGAHHRAVHTGALVIAGCASQGFVFRHADGSEYGQLASPTRADQCAKVFQALRNLGFKETESRRAIDAACAHVGADSSVETLLRAALARLSERTLRVSDSARPRYSVGFGVLGHARSRLQSSSAHDYEVALRSMAHVRRRGVLPFEKSAALRRTLSSLS